MEHTAKSSSESPVAFQTQHGDASNGLADDQWLNQKAMNSENIRRIQEPPLGPGEPRHVMALEPKSENQASQSESMNPLNGKISEVETKNEIESRASTSDVDAGEETMEQPETNDTIPPVSKESQEPADWLGDFKFWLRPLLPSRRRMRPDGENAKRTWFGNWRPGARNNPVDPEPGFRTDYICLVLGDGRPTEWRLVHIPFYVNGDGFCVPAEDGKNSAVFERIRDSIAQELGKNWFRQLLFPYRLAKVEYALFELYNQKDRAVHVIAHPRRVGEYVPFGTEEPEWVFIVEHNFEPGDLMAEKLRDSPLSRYVKNPWKVDDGSEYWDLIPRKKRKKLVKHSPKNVGGMGLVATVELNYVMFLAVWAIIVLILALALCLGLALPQNSPLHGNVVVVGIFFGMFSLLALFYNLVYNYAKRIGVF